MRKYGRSTVQDIVKRACKEFMEDDSTPDWVTFYFMGHLVNAVFEWSEFQQSWYLSYFDVVYSRSVMRYNVNEDYDMCFAWCW